MHCITFVTEMSKTECEAALAKPEYVKALQDALTTELAKVIKTQLNGDYVSKHRPSIWCGSLVMQAVVGETFAPELNKHYTSGNALELQVEDKTLPFKPQSTTTSTTISTSTSSTTVSTTTTKPSTKPSLRTTTTSASTTSRNAQDQAIEEEEDPSGVMIGVALSGSILLVVVVVVVVVLVCTKNNGEGKGKGSADEDVETYHVTPKKMSDDPNEVSLEMVCMTSSDVNHKKEDNQKAEVEPKPEPENENDGDSGAKSTSDNPESRRLSTVENSV